MSSRLKVGDMVRFAHQADGPIHRVAALPSINGIRMVELDDMPGQFGDHLFLLADDRVARVARAIGQLFIDRTKSGAPVGHGNVFPSRSGAHARCLGPIHCPECKAEAEQIALVAIAAMTGGE